MNREQFLEKLKNKLKGLPAEDVSSALEYYEEYLDDAGPENEEATIAAWGSPDQLAGQILADYAVKQVNAEPSAKKSLSTAWVVILAICASPIAVPVAAVIICLMATLIIAVAAVILGLGGGAVGLLAGGAASVIMGFGVIFQSISTTIFFVGLGLFSVGAGAALMMFVIWLSKAGIRWVAKLFSKVLPRRKTHE